jgi:hypothetical protein
MNILGASIPPFRHIIVLPYESPLDCVSVHPNPISAILSFKLILCELKKKEIEYLVSPNKSAIYSAMTMALSLTFNLTITIYFFSSLKMHLTLIFTVLVHLVNSSS